LIQQITGDERPKQFFPLVGQETLLDQTGRRTTLAVPPDRSLLVLTRDHERFYHPLLAGLPPSCAVIQPENRGTAAAILYALLRVAAMEPRAVVGIFPSDHSVSNDAAFMKHVDAAFGAVEARPDLVVVLGIVPDGLEGDYGWIEPAEPITTEPGVLSRVRGFWEKPSRDLARALRAQGCLWNSFVLVGHLVAFLALLRGALPELAAAFDAVRPALNTSREGEVVQSVYAELGEFDFSRHVLAKNPASLAVLPVLGVGWSDWGEPGRVLARLASIGVRSEWVGTPLAGPG
jgi:mannose-1-phosphate guanylyltransferase